ncbi:hypothetical protein ABZP36_023616 [Zizania latifolia]
MRLSNRKLVVGVAVIAVALLICIAQFYSGKFSQNRDFLLICIALYVVLNVVLQIVSDTMAKSAILFTYPPAGSFDSAGLVISSKLPRLSDMYTLTIASADPECKSANEPVHFTKGLFGRPKSWPIPLGWARILACQTRPKSVTKW